MTKPFASTLAVLISCIVAGCATAPKGPARDGYAAATPFAIRTAPAGAAVETSQGFRCNTPCQIPLSSTSFVATVTMLGYKPVQVPVTAGQSPGTLDIRLVPQDPGAGAPNPVSSGKP